MRPDPDLHLPEMDQAQPTIWLGFQAVTVLARVVLVVVLSLALFLSVFLGYITLPIIAPILLGLGYAGVVLGRKAGRPST
jgi:hypothetical protein